MSENIQVVTELLGDDDDLRDTLRAAQADLDAFVGKANAMRIDISAHVLDQLTPEVQKLVAEASKLVITIPVQLGGLSTMPGSGGAGGASFNNANSFNTANFQQNISNQTANLVSQVDNSLQQTLNQLFAEYTQNITSNSTTINNAGGGGRGGAGGGTRGFGRYLGPAFLAREAMREIQQYRQQAIEESLADNDSLAKAMAAEGAYHKIAEVPIFGQIADIMVDPTGSQNEEIQRNIRDSKTQGEIGLQSRDNARETQRANFEASIAGSSGSEVEKKKVDQRLLEEANKRKDQREKDDALWRKLHDSKITQENERYDQSIRGDDGELLDDDETVAARKKHSDVIAGLGAEARDRAKIIDSQQPQLAVDAAKQAKADKDEIDRKEVYANSRSAAVVADVGASADEAQMRAGGQGRAAASQTHARKLADDVQSIRDKATSTTDPDEKYRLTRQADALDADRGRAMSEFNDRQGAKAAFDKSESDRHRAAAAGAADAGLTRAGGDTRAADRARLALENDQKMGRLQDQLKKPDLEDSERESIGKDIEQEKIDAKKRIGAQELDFTKQTADAIADINTDSHAKELAADGRFYEAKLATLTAGYDKIIRKYREAGRNAEADDVEKEKTAALAAADRTHNTEIADINEQAKEKDLQNKRQPKTADVAHLEYEHAKQLADAKGDPQKIAAINDLYRANLEGVANRPIDVTTSSMREVYTDLQKSVLMGSGGDDANARARATRDLHADPNRPGYLHGVKMPAGWKGGLPSNAAADAAKGAVSSIQDQQSQAQTDAANKIGKAADLIVNAFANATQLVVLSGAAV